MLTNTRYIATVLSVRPSYQVYRTTYRYLVSLDQHRHIARFSLNGISRVGFLSSRISFLATDLSRQSLAGVWRRRYHGGAIGVHRHRPPAGVGKGEGERQFLEQLHRGFAFRGRCEHSEDYCKQPIRNPPRLNVERPKQNQNMQNFGAVTGRGRACSCTNIAMLRALVVIPGTWKYLLALRFGHTSFLTRPGYYFE